MLIFFGTAADVEALGAGMSGNAVSQQIKAAADGGHRIRLVVLDESRAMPAVDGIPGSVELLSANPAEDGDLGLECGAHVVVNVETPFAHLMKVARAARDAGAYVVFNLSCMPAIFAMPELHAVLGRTDILILRQAELQKAVGLLGQDMLGDCETTAEMVGALAYWASFAVVATDGRDGALYAEGEAPAQRFLSPRGEDINERAVSNSFVGALTAALSSRKPMPEAIEAALAKATSPQAQAAS
ncbi:PfkB family carbohydrate kinase [Aureimonas altamirensis]|uniref:PfkB family carbohydrate kinase n=1 Tax=Aureimonas altamirensis TaxID=370622 RepID=UPI0030189AF6